mgnify:CR=1 FL=1
MNHQNTISYYLDCYKEDSADLNLWNLNRLKKEDRLLLEGTDELGSGFLPRLPIDKGFAEQMLKRVEMYQRERVLLYARFILVGKLDIRGESRSVVCPVLFQEANIEKCNNDYYLSVPSETPELNDPLIQLLMPEGHPTNELDDIENIKSASFWTSWLSDSAIELNTLELLNFPVLANNEQIKKALRRKVPSLLPASMLVFVERSTSSRGVLHELEEIKRAEKLSPPLTDLFNASMSSVRQRQLKCDYLPGLLSTAQQKVLSIAANANIGCVSGPPGTGKSYTIAAIAAEHIARGESVLVVANNDAALDVIADKLDQNFGLSDISIRAGQKEFLKQLKEYISDLLSGYFSKEKYNVPLSLEKKLNELNHSLNDLERHFLRCCQKAIVRGQRLKKLETNGAKWSRSIYLAFAKYGIRKLAAQWASLNQINVLQTEREALASSYLTAVKNDNLKTLIETQRKSLQAFNKAIRSRTSKRQFEMFDDIEYSALLSAFPVWLASLNSLYRVLPLKRQMFDLVIIDEATQCNISSCLPALYRAKRAIIVGDTKQLKHYSFLARHKESQLMQQNEVSLDNNGIVSYRDSSILDLTLESIASEDQIAFLDEHFRSKPELIHFSNKHFYQSKLKVMQHRPCTSSGYLHLVRTDGLRDKHGVNVEEAKHIVQAIKTQIAEDNECGVSHSIGVVSPFRSQSEFIANEIESNFSEFEITKHNIRVATPFGFQGEERDIMLISFCIDDDSKRAAVYLNKADVFNVTVTRARQKQILFISIDEFTLPEHSLLRKYLASIEDFKVRHAISTDIDDFQQDVIKELDKLNILHWAGYTIAGAEVDILCRHNNEYVAIDLIGFPGPWEGFFELNTYKLFKRAGIEILPISYGLWVINKEACVARIAKQLSISLPSAQNVKA